MARLAVRGSGTETQKRARPIVVALGALLFFGAPVLVYVLGRTPSETGEPDPQTVISEYLQALRDRDATRIERLTSRQDDSMDVARAHVARWGGIDPAAVAVTEEASPVGKIRRFRLVSQSNLTMDEEVNAVKASSGKGWLLAIAKPPGRPSDDGAPGLSEPPP